MQRRLVILVVSLSLMATVLAAALVVRPPAAVRLSEAPGEASHVALYQNGLAAVRLVRSFESTGGESRLSFPLPPTTVYDSVTLEGAGVRVKEIRSALSQTSGIHPGDAVIIHVGDQSYRGTVQAIEGGKIALRTATGIAYVETARADAIEVEGALDEAAASPGSVEATALVIAEPGVHTVTLSYLVQGPGWTPSYRLDSETGRVVFFATLEAVDDWSGVTLDLFSGAPHLVYAPAKDSLRFYGAETTGLARMDAAPSFESSFAPSAPLGDLHRYRLAGTIDLARGESVRLVIAEGTLDVARRYHEVVAGTGWGGASGDGQDLQVLERITLRNTMSEPLPPGIVRIDKEGEFIGEDMLPNLPVGDEGNVTLSFTRDVRARLVLVEHSSTPSLDRYAYELTVRNLFAGNAAKSIDLRAVLTYPTWRTTLVSSTPGAVATGGQLAWDAEVGPGGAATYRMTYETLKYG